MEVLIILLVLIYLAVGVHMALELDADYKSLTAIFWLLIVFVSLFAEVKCLIDEMSEGE